MIKSKKYKAEDVNEKDLNLLAKACSLPEKSFLCFGSSWAKLYELGLIAEDSQPTKLGKDLIRQYSRSH
jgi:hypothetical protein